MPSYNLFIPSPAHLMAVSPILRTFVMSFLSFSPTALTPPPINRVYIKSPTYSPISSPISVPTTGIGISVPNNPPKPAPTPLKSACWIGSPFSSDATTVIRGPITGILSFLASDAGILNFLATL